MRASAYMSVGGGREGHFELYFFNLFSDRSKKSEIVGSDVQYMSDGAKVQRNAVD
jgi:hypothetical protein